MRLSRPLAEQGCSLAQLAKNMKKLVFQDPKQPVLEPSLEVAQACEVEVMAWLGELPPAFRVQAEVDPTQPPPAYLLAQRCELAMIANSLILKVFLPFVKKSSARPGDNVIYASVNAAHKIIHAADQLQQHMKGPRHSLAFMSYFFNSQLFHAAVICANTCIQEPTSIHSKQCLKDLHEANRIMRDPYVPTSRGPIVGGVEGSKSEALRVLDMLQKKAEDAARGSMFTTGTKRKHSEVEEQLQPGFHIPYAGPAIVTSPANSISPPAVPGSSTSQSSTSRSKTATSERPIQPATHAWSNEGAASPGTPSTSSTLRVGATRERAKTHSHYPSTGVRVRPQVATKADSGVPRRDSVGSSARRSVPPSSSGPSQTPRTVPPTPQSHSPTGPSAGPQFTTPRSGPPSASTSGPRPMETNGDYALTFGDSRHMAGVAGPFPTAYPTSSPPQPGVYASGPSYGPPPPGYYMGPPGHVQYHGPPLQPQPFDTSQMVYGSMPSSAHLDTSSAHMQPPSRNVSTPVPTQFLPPPPQQDAEGSGHESSESGAYRVQPQWSADDSSPYSRWNYDGYPQ